MKLWGTYALGMGRLASENWKERLFSVVLSEGTIFYSSVCVLYRAPHLPVLSRKLSPQKEILNSQCSAGKTTNGFEDKGDFFFFVNANKYFFFWKSRDWKDFLPINEYRIPFQIRWIFWIGTWPPTYTSVNKVWQGPHARRERLLYADVWACEWIAWVSDCVVWTVVCF